MILGQTALPSTDAEKEIEYKENLCTESEETLFSFKLADSSKTLSVCVSKEQQDYIVYRLGSKDKIELEFPKIKQIRGVSLPILFTRVEQRMKEWI